MTKEPIKVMAELGDKAKYLANLSDEHYEYAIANPEIITKVYDAAVYTAKYILWLEGKELEDYINGVIPTQLYNTINNKMTK